MRVDLIHPAIYRITTPFGEGGTVVLYLIKGDRIALVDTGAAHSPSEVLRPALAEIGLALSDVALILNTHAHLDHAGGNLAIKQVSSASIHIHSADVPMSQSTEAQVEFMTAPLRALEMPEQVIRLRAEYVRRMAGESIGTDIALSDGDVIELGAGVRLRAVHAPGHTPGSVCYYWESERVLFTGDAVQGQGSRSGAYPLYFDAANYRRSLAALAQLDVQLLCAGHAFLGGSVVNDPSRRGEECATLLQQSIQVADAIHSGVVGAMRRMAGASKREIPKYEAAAARAVMGGPQGPGCYCYPNDLLRKHIDTISKNYDYLVADIEVRMEAFGIAGLSQ